MRPEHVCALAAVLAGCASVPPPPADVASAPEPVLPSLQHAPPAPPAGLGMVVFDSVSGPASVSRVVGENRVSGGGLVFAGGGGFFRYRGRTLATADVCPETPCVAYLPFGDHHVIFESTENDRRADFVVTSSDVARALRASLDLRIRQDWKRPFGLAVMATGLIAAGIGAYSVVQASNSGGGESSAGPAVLAGGGILTLVGAILFATGHPSVFYEGKGTVWDLKAPSPAPPSPAGGMSL